MLRNTKRITGQVGWAGSERNMAPSLLCGQATIREYSNIGGPRKKKRYEKNADGAVFWGGWVSKAQCLSYYKNWFQRVTVNFFLRYLTHASENKQEVDPTPVLWTATDPTGADLDAYAESQKTLQLPRRGGASPKTGNGGRGCGEVPQIRQVRFGERGGPSRIPRAGGNYPVGQIIRRGRRKKVRGQ